MSTTIKNGKMIRNAGIIGITAVIITIISDMILLGRPAAAFSFFDLMTESMAELAPWRITTGTFLGVFALPFQIAGIVPLYFGLKQAGNRLALVVLGSAAYGLIMGVAFHVSYAYMGSAWQLFYKADAGKDQIQKMLSQFEVYWMIIIVTVFAVLLIASVCYFILIMSGKSAYPKWMAFLNPICIFALVFVLVLPIPAPVGGYIAPVYLNFSTFVLFVLSIKLGKVR